MSTTTHASAAPATDADTALAPGSIIAANHTSLADAALVLAARALAGGGHIPVLRGDRRAAAALDTAAEALERGRLVLIYAEGGLPRRKDATEAAPSPFRSGLGRLAERTGAPVVPVGQAGARRVTSGGVGKQLAGLATAPLRRPGLHVHVGAPLRLTGDCQARTARARTAVTHAWRTAAAHLDEFSPIAA